MIQTKGKPQTKPDGGGIVVWKSDWNAAGRITEFLQRDPVS
jgi:hypothetical protein